MATWKILYLIGSGTFAPRLSRGASRKGTVAAVKVLHCAAHRSEPSQVEQFMRDAKVGIQLRHPNIVAIYEVDPDPRNPSW